MLKRLAPKSFYLNDRSDISRIFCSGGVNCKPWFTNLKLQNLANKNGPNIMIKFFFKGKAVWDVLLCRKLEFIAIENEAKSYILSELFIHRDLLNTLFKVVYSIVQVVQHSVNFSHLSVRTLASYWISRPAPFQRIIRFSE